MKGGQNLAFKFIFSWKTLTFLSTETARIKKANLLVGLVKSKETRQKSLKLKNRLPLVGHISINNAAKSFSSFPGYDFCFVRWANKGFLSWIDIFLLIKYGQFQPLFRLFSSFFHSNLTISTIKIEKALMVCLGFEPEPHNIRRRRNHGAVAAALG